MRRFLLASALALALIPLAADAANNVVMSVPGSGWVQENAELSAVTLSGGATISDTGVLTLTPSMAASHVVRGVVTVNESITAFDAVAGGTARDGVTYIAGDRVLLANQTTKSQDGPWIVGTVSGGVAPLTRPTDFAHGEAIPSGTVFEVSEGTLFANSTWKITTAGTITVDTTAFDIYPRLVTQSVTLTSGAVTISNVPLLSSSKTSYVINRITPSGTTSTILYGPSAVTPGIVGTASLTVAAQVAAGTTNTSDVSTLEVSIVNW